MFGVCDQTSTIDNSECDSILMCLVWLLNLFWFEVWLQVSNQEIMLFFSDSKW